MLFKLLSTGPRFVLRAFMGLGVALLLLFGLRYSTLPLYERWTAIAVMARDEQFNYVTWEINALATKTVQALYGQHPYMTEAQRVAYVRDYMKDLASVQSLESRINAVYANPEIDDPEAESAEMRLERDHLRAELRQRQPLAEAILEGQVAAVLVDQRFGVYGQLLPPISAHFTRVPNLLIVSPREKISFDVSINLNPMTVDEMAALEASIDEAQNVASLIVPLGGIALYPAMILETASIPYAVEVIAHEWLHHYLFAFPLGYTYDFAGEARIINETTASLFGKEVARLVLARYYPEYAPPVSAVAKRDSEGSTAADRVEQDAPPEPVFDFGAEMHETRVRVDELLAEGKVEEAEAYMEERRELFNAHGYMIRKLNQAFFAFYGGYQSGAPGEGGSDPIGPAVQAIYEASPSIYDWIATMRGITTREQLLAAREVIVPEQAET